MAHKEKLKSVLYTKAELESFSILRLRKMAEASKLPTRRKSDIVAALSSDYRLGPGTVAVPATPAPIVAPVRVGATPPPQGPHNNDEHPREHLVWPTVPVGACEVNGLYVLPPWYEELAAAAAIGHVELMGPAGSGKTLAVHHLAASQGKRLAVVTADGGLRKRDLVGQRELLGGSTVFQASEFAAAARAGDWALIDEANMAEADALGFLNGMLDRPGTTGSTFSVGGKAIEVHPEFRCFITRNPGYQGTKLMNEALRDRFWSIDVPPLLGEGLATMFASHGIDPKVSEEAVYLVGILYQAWERNRISYQISPRRALSAARMGDCLKGDGTNHNRDLLTRSILTKIDAKHERETVKGIIQAAWTARDVTKRGETAPTVDDL